MKRTEKIVFLLLGVTLLIIYPNTSSFPAFCASAFTVLSGMLFFALNTQKGICLLSQRKGSNFFLQNLLPFLVCYGVALLLNVWYWMSFSPDASFKWRYLLESFPHKESAMLPVLYTLGLFYGYLRPHMKAVKVTLAAVAVLLISGFIYLNIPVEDRLAKNENYHIITQEVQSIDALIKQPQFKDKTLYIDLWYSSCSPCVKQFKEYLPQLKKEITKQGVSVEYIYLARETSHPDSKQRWRNAIEKYELKGWHYYFVKEKAQGYWDEITRELHPGFTAGYPHYLIAKNGKIVSYNAPYPEEVASVLNLLKP
ncbi:TlpA family protein disulfide reductase [Robertkochia flava]|uniref:TlpA family protein disulfide reductase n=1 Tax=Robertkochia flava TaxID=3447986 RepID=UPI001CCD561D|nr:hypothetical protein [Robertkochia marina]